MKTIVRLFSVFLLLSLLLAGQGIRPAYAAGYVVNTLNDTDDGTCDATDCSLSEAINAANASSANDTITFSVSGTIPLGSTLPNIANAATAGALTIDGGGNITISGNSSVRVMVVNTGANLTVQNLTIVNGNAGGDPGGGIYNYGTLTVTNSTFSNNSAANGGGIFNAGTLTVTNSTFSGNSATSDGGGIANLANSTATVTNSTFSGNSANGGGGGIINNSGTLTVTNSTFSGNSAASGGAAISTWKGAATPPTTTIRNTILANSPSGVDCWNHTAGGAILNGGNNIIETNSGCSGIATITSDPNLDTLTGSPAYFPLNPGSPAINAGDNAACPTADQRGVSRPQGAACDIGSYEMILSPQTYVVNTPSDNTDNGDGYCTLREAILAANSAANNDCGPASSADDTITFSVSGTIGLGSTLPAIANALTNGALTIDGAGQTVTISGGGLVQVMVVNTGANLTVQNLTIANGNASGDAGGGIKNSGTLTVTNATFSNNNATWDGGAIENLGTLTVTNSAFLNNLAAYGGAIENFTGSTLTVTNSTFSGNSANWGGGIYNKGALSVTNATFSSNSATSGGGIYVFNSAATLQNTLIANSTSGGDCVNNGGSVTGNNNLIEDSANACGLTNGVDGNIIGSDPNLGALSGSPAYFPLNAGSPAIDAGDNAACPATDQRGVVRPQGAICDIGSYELQTGQQFFYSIGTQDGWILESSETSNAGGMMNSTASTFNLGDDAQNRQYRVILSFNTSALPDNAVITNVTLWIKKRGLVGANPFNVLGGLKVDIRRPYFGTAAALEASDFQAAANKPNVATFDITPMGNRYSATLNVWGRAYINKTGTTQFRLRFATDDNNNNAADYMRFFSGNYGTVSDRPTLIVEYYVP